MTTLSVIREHIKRDLFIQDSKYDSRIDDSIRTALRSKEHDKWWFLERIGTMALAAGSPSATLPTDCGALHRISCIQNNTRYQLVDMPYKDLEARYYHESPIRTGRPVAYALVYRTPYFSHIADVDYSLPIIYYARDVTLPIAGSDTSIWFQREGYDVIREQAMYLFRVNVMEEKDASEAGSTIAYQRLSEQHRKYRRY